MNLKKYLDAEVISFDEIEEIANKLGDYFVECYKAMGDWFEVVWYKFLGIGAKGILFAIAPLATKLEDQSKELVMKPEVKLVLDRYGKLKAFKQRKLSCAVCHSTISFDNLGMLSEKEELELVCDNPGCALKAYIGWTEARDDEQINRYTKKFVRDNYGRIIDDELAYILVFIIDDLLTDIQYNRAKKGKKIIEKIKKQEVKMSKTRLGNRIVNFERGIYTTTINGKSYSTRSWDDLKRKIAVFESGKTARAGKRTLAKWRIK